MRIVVMYTRRHADDPWFNTPTHSEYGLAIKSVTKTNRIESTDKLTLWEFVEISDPTVWETLRQDHLAIREVEFKRKKSLGISAELIELEGETGSEFFEYLADWDGETKTEYGKDVDISKFFW